MITVTRVGGRVYLSGLPFALKDKAKQIGCHWDPVRREWWIGAAKAADAEALAAQAAAEAATPAGVAAGVPPESRVLAKVAYKGRTFYVLAETADQTRCRLVGLADDSIPFWADCAACDLLKRYQPREHRGRTVYTTIGGIREFVAAQKDAKAAGRPTCAACGLAGDLVPDLEDGLLKHYKCCDMPQ